MQVSCAFSAVIACGHCVVPQNIHTHPLDSHWKFQRGWGWGCQKPKFVKINMKLDWNVQIGEGRTHGYFLETHINLWTKIFQTFFPANFGQFMPVISDDFHDH